MSEQKKISAEATDVLICSKMLMNKSGLFLLPIGLRANWRVVDIIKTNYGMKTCTLNVNEDEDEESKERSIVWSMQDVFNKFKLVRNAKGEPITTRMQLYKEFKNLTVNATVCAWNRKHKEWQNAQIISLTLDGQVSVRFGKKKEDDSKEVALEMHVHTSSDLILPNGSF